jgi:hypothetical protein
MGEVLVEQMLTNTYSAIIAIGDGLDHIFLYKGARGNQVFKALLDLNHFENRALYREVRLFLILRRNCLHMYRKRRTMSQHDFAQFLNQLYSRLGQLGYLFSVYKYVYHYILYKDGVVAGGHAPMYAFRDFVSVIKNATAKFALKVDDLGERNIQKFGYVLGGRFTLNEWADMGLDFTPRYQEIISKEESPESLEMSAYAAEVLFHRMRIIGYRDQKDSNYHVSYYLDVIRNNMEQNLRYGVTDPIMENFTQMTCVMFMERSARDKLFTQKYPVSEHYRGILRRTIKSDLIELFQLDLRGIPLDLLSISLDRVNRVDMTGSQGDPSHNTFDWTTFMRELELYPWMF